MTAVQLIVGLGNPGPEYDQTRHTAGALFVERLADSQRINLSLDKKYFGLVGKFNHQGRDVRLLIPEQSDTLLVSLAAYPFIDPLLEAGIRIYRYQPGLMHGKAFLIDDSSAAVSTANLDNRSLRINFESTALVADPDFVTQVDAMFEEDFAASREIEPEEFAGKPLWFRISARAAYLFAPIL